MRFCVPGVNYSQVIVWRAKALGIIVLGMGVIGGNCLRGSCPGTNYSEVIVNCMGEKSPGGNCPGQSFMGS